ncbi:gustatory receptor [Homalodisca vitripennis]|nr:gustatory receptor [Homalodisca vitripennis]
MGDLSIQFLETEPSVMLFALSVINGNILLMELVIFSTYAMKYPRFLKCCTLLEEFDHTLQLGTSEYRNTGNLIIIILSTVTPVILEGAELFTALPKKENELIIRRMISYVFMVVITCGRTGILIHFQRVTYAIADRFSILNERIRREVLLKLSQSIQRQNPSCADLTLECVTRNVQSLMSAYHLLCDVVNQANVFYNDLLLVSIVTAFMNITVSLYFSILSIVQGNLAGIIAMAVWNFSQASFLVLVTLSSSGVSEVARETAPLVRKLISQDLGSELREQLKSFLLQLLDKNVEFSASGFFPINRQMLTSIAAAVTTYLIRTSAQTPMVNKQEMLICKNRATIDLAEAWSMSWREKNIKTEEEGGEEEVEAGNSKSEVRECLCSCAEKYL